MIIKKVYRPKALISVLNNVGTELNPCRNRPMYIDMGHSEEDSTLISLQKVLKQNLLKFYDIFWIRFIKMMLRFPINLQVILKEVLKEIRSSLPEDGSCLRFVTQGFQGEIEKNRNSKIQRNKYFTTEISHRAHQVSVLCTILFKLLINNVEKGK